MNKKYVIKNCPACYLYSNKYGCEDNHDEQGRDTYCELIDDCVMKNIVELCKDVQTKEYRKGRRRFRSPSKASFGRDILQLLQIEEVE